MFLLLLFFYFIIFIFLYPLRKMYIIIDIKGMESHRYDPYSTTLCSNYIQVHIYITRLNICEMDLL